MRTSVDVHNYLVERDIPHEVFTARGRLRSPERIAAVLGLRPSEVGKVVILESGDGAVVAVVPSDHDADPKRVSRAVRRARLKPVGEDRASEITGYLAESTPPAGLPDDIRVVVDRTMHCDEVLYFPGGEVHSVLKVRGTDLVKATGATVAAIAAPPVKAQSGRA